MNVEIKPILDQSVLDELKSFLSDQFSVVIQKYLENIQIQITVAEQSIKEKDQGQLEMAAHTIKGSSSQFGAMQLQQAAIELENWVMKGDFQQAESQLINVKEQFIIVSDLLT